MRRQRRAVQFRLRVPDTVTAARIIRQRTGRRWNERGLRARVRDDGRIRARTGGGRYHTPPRLVGRITAGPHGVVLEATVLESYAGVLLPRLYVGLTGLMAAVCVALLAAGEFANPGVYICGTAAVAFGAIGHRTAGQRAGSFRHDADQLEHAIRAVVPD